MAEFQLPPTAALSSDYVNWLKSLFVKILSERKDLIESWIKDEESQVFDLLVAVLANQSPLIAALLAQAKGKLLDEANGLTDEVINKIIEKLKS